MNHDDLQSREAWEKQRLRRIYIGSIIGHIILVLLPVAALWLDSCFGREPEIIESINIEELPSVGPEVAPETTRLPPTEEEPEPEPQPIPEPQPELPTPVAEPEVALPEVPTTVAEPDLDLPKPPKKVSVKEPNLKLPPVPKTRELTNKPPKKPPTSRNKNELVPIGNKNTAQRHGQTPSNTAQGGPGQNDRYTAVLSRFLKVKWQEYSPSLANLRDDATVGVKLVISPEGRLISGTIIRSSGNTEMDAAARRLIAHLQTITLPKNPGGKRWENTVNLGTKFNNW